MALRIIHPPHALNYKFEYTRFKEFAQAELSGRRREELAIEGK